MWIRTSDGASFSTVQAAYASSASGLLTLHLERVANLSEDDYAWVASYEPGERQSHGRRRITVSPHALRHTFLRKLAEEKGVHYAKEASGHRSYRDIWRYVKLNSEPLADAIDHLE
jgi:integrase